MLEFYSSRLKGVELNGSFYRMTPESTLVKWRGSTPAGFLFCMKANRGLTYSAEGFDRVGLALSFSRRITALGDGLGPILLQFPPVRQRNVALLDSLLGALRAELEGHFDTRIFLSGFYTNALLAAGLAFLGDRLGIDLYLVALFAFGWRIFQNVAVIRRHFL